MGRPAERVQRRLHDCTPVRPHSRCQPPTQFWLALRDQTALLAPRTTARAPGRPPCTALLAHCPLTKPPLFCCSSSPARCTLAAFPARLGCQPGLYRSVQLRCSDWKGVRQRLEGAWRVPGMPCPPSLHHSTSARPSLPGHLCSTAAVPSLAAPSSPLLHISCCTLLGLCVTRSSSHPSSPVASKGARGRPSRRRARLWSRRQQGAAA